MLAMAYGVFCYGVFFATFLYAIGFIGDFVVPQTIDSGEAGPVGIALLTDLGLLSLFAIQHSVMARPGFKRWWTRMVPAPVERATYVLFSSLVLILLFAAWQPIEGFLWQVSDPIGRNLLHGGYFLGIATVLYSTLLIDHFDLFGLRQVYHHYRGEALSSEPFTSPGLYRFIRHPLYVGWFLSFWMTPDMSMGHLLFAVGCTGYILAAVPLEERDLADALGSDYSAWRSQTPAFFPRFGGRRSATANAKS